MRTKTVEELIAEGLISMSEAAKMFGSCRNGKPTHPATLTRKCLKGDLLPDGTRLRLEHVRVANRLMTTRQAVIRHLTALTEALNRNDSIPSRSPNARHRQSEAAGRELARRGGS